MIWLWLTGVMIECGVAGISDLVVGDVFDGCMLCVRLWLGLVVVGSQS